MKLQIVLETDVEDSLTGKSPLIKLLKQIAGKNDSPSLRWYSANKERLSQERKEKNKLYRQLQKIQPEEKIEESAVIVNEVRDGILRFD
jgi:hypothetical protein